VGLVVVVVLVLAVVLGVVFFRARRQRVLDAIESTGVVPNTPTDDRARSTLDIESRGFRGPYG
jgi:hypothetical protein